MQPRSKGSADGADGADGASGGIHGSMHLPPKTPPMASLTHTQQLAGASGALTGASAEPRGSQLLPLRVCGTLVGPPSGRAGWQLFEWEGLPIDARVAALASKVDSGEEWELGWRPEERVADETGDAAGGVEDGAVASDPLAAVGSLMPPAHIEVAPTALAGRELVRATRCAA